VRRQLLPQNCRHFLSRQEDHPVREPPPRSAARKPKFGDWATFGTGSRMQVPAPVRPRESIERLMAKGTPVVLPQLAQIHNDIVESGAGDSGRLQF
jgi:hypothetical protein